MHFFFLFLWVQDHNNNIFWLQCHPHFLLRQSTRASWITNAQCYYSFGTMMSNPLSILHHVQEPAGISQLCKFDFQLGSSSAKKTRVHKQESESSVIIISLRSCVKLTSDSHECTCINMHWLRIQMTTEISLSDHNKYHSILPKHLLPSKWVSRGSHSS